VKEKQYIRKAAVLGAGVMGAQLSAHLANACIPVALFDLAQADGDPNALARQALKMMAKLKPAPYAVAGIEAAITPANYDQDLASLHECDLVIEAISERMDWKTDLFGKVAPHLAPHAILASNTSGLGINKLAEALPAAVRKRFLGIHFFNPPRYMHLVELIPARDTDPEAVAWLEAFLVSNLGKGVVIAKDTPNFIGNRVGVFSILATLHHTERLELGCEVVDALTGKPLGRPKSATFRTVDVVGLDTFYHVVETFRQHLADDPWHPWFETPAWVNRLIEEGALGAKTGTGIYADKGKKVVDPRTGAYRAADGDVDETVQALLKERDPGRQLAALRASPHPQAQLVWSTLRDLLHYCAVHLAEIADSARDVDFAMRWGYGWSRGPFETWQAAGWRQVADWIAEDIAAGKTMSSAPLPAWVTAIDAVHTPAGAYAPAAGAWLPLSEHPVYQRQRVREDVLGSAPVSLGDAVFEDDAVRVWHDGDDVAVVSLKGKMHVFDAAMLEGVLRAVDIAERQFRGLVVWSPDAPFSAGANLHAVARSVMKGDYDAVERMVALFQEASMALKHSMVPTVAAVQGLALGGGCECQMHCNRTVATLESYVGLVEVGVGLLPAGGGCKELALRAAQLTKTGDIFPQIQAAFENVAMGKVSGSAAEARDMGLMRPDDVVICNPHELLHVARAQVVAMAESAWRPPFRGLPFRAAGKTGIATLKMVMVNMREGKFISDHDFAIGARVAETLCGGEVEAGTTVTDQWLLTLERRHFMELLRTEQTQQRIEHMLKTGKPLRN
jgi:3-hydroxyacyl-CoA dehydrogenase